MWKTPGHIYRDYGYGLDEEKTEGRNDSGNTSYHHSVSDSGRKSSKDDYFLNL